MGANFYSNSTKGHEGLYRVGHALNLAFVGAGAIAVMLLWWRYRVVNSKRAGQRKLLRENFEEDVGSAKRDCNASNGGEEEWKQKERFMRRDFELKREMDLVEHGGESVWFIYTI